MCEAYKAVPFTKITHHDAVINNDEPWENHPAYDTRETRYYIVDVNTGEVLDDAQGYGYKTAQKAEIRAKTMSVSPKRNTLKIG